MVRYMICLDYSHASWRGLEELTRRVKPGDLVYVVSIYSVPGSFFPTFESPLFRFQRMNSETEQIKHASRKLLYRAKEYLESTCYHPQIVIKYESHRAHNKPQEIVKLLQQIPIDIVIVGVSVNPIELTAPVVEHETSENVAKLAIDNPTVDIRQIFPKLCLIVC
eukprot:TRINITY_DN165_c0_g4_i1.p1 TRINITY_DN165_c0_g4~~TRINITY_DN165_c0_g4_i1.p1  ORF type:complete len:165 (-),score=70.75 TRINITY_DN165_c0_g4_i1:31-525(-)